MLGIGVRHLINAKKISEYGVEVVKTKDGHVDFDATLAGVADRFAAMPDGVEKSTLAMELFGKGGKDLIPLLDQGKDGLKALGDEATRLGLVFDDKALAAAKRFTLAQKDLSENVEGLKNRLGMAFLPVLADVSNGLLGLATAVLPGVTAGIDRLSSFVHTAIGIFHDMQAAVNFKQVGGGDFLASLIGPKAAADFMATVTNVSLTLNHFWETVIKPAFKWLQDNVPIIWANVSGAIADAWTKIEPKLVAFDSKMQGLKEKFDALPGPFKTAMEQIAVSAVIAKATGLDDWIANISNGIQGAGGLTQALIAMKGHWEAAAVAFGTTAAVVLAIASVTVAVYQVGSAIGEIRDHWENLRQAVHDGMQDNGNQVSLFLIRLVEWGDAFNALGRSPSCG
jgi:hypothetical protein